MRTPPSSNAISNSQRDEGLDALRGILIVIMAIDHWGGPLKHVTYEMPGYVGATEGFFFLSAYMGALVYGRHAAASKLELIKRCWQRAFVVYAYCVGLAWAILLLAYFFSAPFGVLSRIAASLENPIAAFSLSAALIFGPGLSKILGYYVFYLLLLPFLILALERGYGKVVLLLSGVFWLGGQFGIGTWSGGTVLWSVHIEPRPFVASAWQLLFVAGAYCGYRRLKTNQPICSSGHLLLPATTVALILFFLRNGLAAAYDLDLGVAVAKDNLGWLRIVNFAAIAYLCGWVANNASRLLHFRWLERLGSVSLQMFTLHAFLLQVIDPVKWRIANLPIYDGVSSIVFVLVLVFSSRLLIAIKDKRGQILRYPHKHQSQIWDTHRIGTASAARLMFRRR